MSHRSLVAVAVIAAASTLGACGRSDDNAGDVSHKDGVDHIQIAVSNYGAGSYGLPQLIAQKEGFFRRNRIVVDRVVGSAGGGTTVRLLLSGRLAFADGAVGATVQAAMHGTPLKIIGGSIQDLRDACLITRAGDGLRSMKELAGKTLSYSNPGSASEGFIRLAAARSGAPLSRFHFKATGGVSEGVTLLKQHQVDQAFGLGAACAKPGEFRAVPSAMTLVPSFQQTMAITTDALIKSNPGLVRRYLLSLQEAGAWIKANPDGAAAQLAKLSEQPVGPMTTFVKRLLEPMHWSVALNGAAMNAALKGVVLSGEIKPGTEIPWGKILDQRFLPAGAAHLDPATLTTR